MNDANRDQVDYWNGEAAARWVARQELLDRALDPLGRVGIARAGPTPGERILDLGCGCGSTSLELAGAVGPQGAVMGLDVSEPMLRRARERARNLTNATFVAGDAAVYPFGAAASFDLAFSRFGVMFFREPESAFANIRGALKPRGRLVFVCWRARTENPWMALPFEAAARIVPAGPPPNPEDPGPFAFANPDRVKRILTAAGFVEVELRPADAPITLGATLDEATTFAVDAGPTARLIEGLGPEVRAPVQDAIRQALKPFAGPDGVALASATWIVHARAG